MACKIIYHFSACYTHKVNKIAIGTIDAKSPLQLWDRLQTGRNWATACILSIILTAKVNEEMKKAFMVKLDRIHVTAVLQPCCPVARPRVLCCPGAVALIFVKK